MKKKAKTAKKAGNRTVRKQQPKPKKKAAKDYSSYHLPIRSEAEQMRDMSEDLRDAWLKLRAFANALGAQKFHTSAKAMMFTRRLCYMFVRPKKAYLEVTFFSAEEVAHPQVAKATRVSKTRASNVFRLVHADQVEAPLTDWVRAAWEISA